MRIEKPYNFEDYAKLAIYCNENRCIIVDRGEYLESVEEKDPEPSDDEKRAAEMPTAEEQLKMLYFDRVNKTDTWFTTLQAIYAKYPQENSDEKGSE